MELEKLEMIDALLGELDAIALDTCPYEFGLPIADCWEGERARMHEVVRAFAERVRQDEREACAKVCDDLLESEGWYECGQAERAAEAIRARGTT